MQRRLRHLTLWLTLSVQPVAAFAQGAGDPDLHLYVGLGAGRLTTEGEPATGARGFIGWQPRAYLGVESGLYQLEDRRLGGAQARLTEGMNVRAQALDLALVGTSSTWHGCSVFTRLGLAHTKLSQTGIGSQSGNGSTLGAGVKVGVTQHLFLRGEWQRFARVGGTDENWDNASLSFGWRF